MKKWETPEVQGLNLSFTADEMGIAAWGERYICTVCCKTSNFDKNQNNAEHFHKGGCPHHPKNNDNNWQDSLFTVVENTKEIYNMCKAHSFS